jgi:putative alpha-1,2-mannosidase
MAGEPVKTQKIVRQIMNELYHTGKDGLCGNEDCGQMSSWYIFSAMGFYPLNPADGRYILGSPALDRAVIQLPKGKEFRIISENNDRGKFEVKEIFLNGNKLNRNYITHKEVVEGGELRFVMKED